MADFEEVKKFVTDTVKKELAPTRIVKVNMREGINSSDGEPSYRIDIVFDGDKIDARKFGNVLLAVDAHFWEIKEEHVPVYSFLKPEDEEWYYAPPRVLTAARGGCDTMRPDNYLATARKLLSGHKGRPRQSDLKKAVSVAYYAVFYALCRNNADCLIGATGANASGPAWRQVFRAVDHGFAKRRCRVSHVMAKFPPRIRAFASRFKALQDKRHEVDYDPEVTLSLAESQAWLDTAAEAITELGGAPIKDRRAFAAWVTVKDRL